MRRAVLPEVRQCYGGDVAWRGVVDERELGCRTSPWSTTMHALAYPIPHYDGPVEPGGRLMNLVRRWNASARRPLAEVLIDRWSTRRDVSLPPLPLAEVAQRSASRSCR